MILFLQRPIDIAILIYFRFFAGILMAQELINGLIIGKFKEYTAPKLHFSFLFFEWIRPWPPWGMALHYSVTIMAALAVALGFRLRYSAIFLCLGYSSLFLMEMSEYINHNYLYCLLAFWLIWLPLDAKKSSPVVPAWMLYIVLFHMGLAYFFGGIAKLNLDWLRGSPMDIFLKDRGAHILGPLYTFKGSPLLFAYGGVLFDLLIVPLLIWKKTRVFGLVIAVIFHLSNVIMFGLATFPWFSLVLTTMFFSPSWPRRLPGAWRLLPKASSQIRPFPPLPILPLTLYALIHVMLPFRHMLYPGNPSWTEEGHQFSWRMMLRNKTGKVRLWTVDKQSGKFTNIDPGKYLTQRQYASMVGKPDLILQFAHFIRDEQMKAGYEVKVFASSVISLNGRRAREIIRPGTNLASEARGLHHYRWITRPETNNLLGENHK